MAISATGGFTVGFNLVTGKFNFTDIGAYVAEGIALTDVIGYFEYVAPDGQTYPAGSFLIPDIDANVSLSNNLINLPLDANGDVQEGTYDIFYRVRVTGAVQPGDYNFRVRIDDFCPEVPTPDFDWNINCFCSQIILQDVTVYTGWTVTNKTLSLYYPSHLALSPYTDSGLTITTVANIHTGTWSASIVATLTKDFGDHVVTAAFTGATAYEEKDVNCDIDRCSLTCCFESAITRWETARTNGDRRLAEYETQLAWMSYYEAAFNRELLCSRYDEAQAFYAKIASIGNCSGCGCGEGESTEIVPVCSPAGANITVIQGAGIVVTLAGSTYTVAMNPTTLAKINAARIPRFTNNDPSYLTITDALSGDPIYQDFDVDYTGPVIDEAEYYSCVLEVTLGGGAGPVYSVTNEKINGVTGNKVFKRPTFATTNYNIATWPSTMAAIDVTDFYNINPGGGVGPFKVFVERQDDTTIIPVLDELTRQDGVATAVIEPVRNGLSSSFKIKLMNEHSPVSWFILGAVFTKIYIAINIKE